MEKYLSEMDGFQKNMNGYINKNSMEQKQILQKH